MAAENPFVYGEVVPKSAFVGRRVELTHVHRRRQVLRQPDDQAQPVLGEPHRQLVERHLGLLLDLAQLVQQLVLVDWHGGKWCPNPRLGKVIGTPISLS